jgi:hypothetical protein
MSKERTMRHARLVAGLALLAAPWGTVRADEASTQPLLMGKNKVTDRGTLVTVHAEAIPARQALYELQMQSNVRVQLEDDSAGDQLVTFSAEDAPVMEVLSGILGVLPRGGARWSMSMREGEPPWSCSGRISAKGPLLMAAEGVLHEADYRRKSGQEERFVVQVRVAIDPSLRPVAFAEWSPAGEAVDEGGKSLAPASTGEGRRVTAVDPQQAIDRAWAGTTEIALFRPAGAGKVIKTLSGKIPVWVATKTEVLELREATEEKKTVAGVPATVKLSSDANQRRWEIQCAFTRPAGVSDDAWKERQTMLAATRIWVEGSDGKMWTCNSWGRGDLSKSKWFNVPGGDSGTPGRAVVEMVTEMKRVELPYAFQDLPLP